MWNWQRDISKLIEGSAEKGNIFRSKLERSILRNCSVFSEFISQSYIFPFKKPFAKAVLVELAKGCWKPIEGYGEKGNIFSYELQRSGLRNGFLFCKFPSQSYSFPLKKPFAKAVLVEFAK